MSVLKTVAAKSEQRDDEDPYKAKLAWADGTQLAYPYTHNTGWEDNITSCQTHGQMSSHTRLIPEGVNGHIWMLLTTLCVGMSRTATFMYTGKVNN